MPNLSSKKILFADDDPDICELFDHFLKQKGVNVTTIQSGEYAKLLLETQKFDAVITDIHMPGTSGIKVRDVCRHLHVPVVFFTGATHDYHHMIFDTPVVEKPCTVEYLLAVLKETIEDCEANNGKHT